MAEEETPQGEPETFTKDDVAKMIAESTEAATKGLKSKVEELLGEKKAASAKAREAEEAAAKAAEEAAKKSGDVETLEKSWADKFGRFQEESAAEKAAMVGTIEKLTVGSQATALAAEMAVQGSASVLERIVRDRLKVEMTEEGPKVRVLDASGQISAASIADLKSELTADPALAPIIAASKGSGGGAPKPNGGAGASKTIAASELDKMTAKDKAKYFADNPGVVVVQT